jgi:ATP-dependent helicase HrpB
MKRLPLHPRLARMLLEGRGSRDVALACALLSERHAPARHPATTTSDLLSAVDDQQALPPHIREVAHRLADAARDAIDDRSGAVDVDPASPANARSLTREQKQERGFLRAIFAGYPDRVARRRATGSPKFLLASGHGAVLGRESGVRDAEFLVAVDVQAGRRGEIGEATIRMASAIDPEWLGRGTGGLLGCRSTTNSIRRPGAFARSSVSCMGRSSSPSGRRMSIRKSRPACWPAPTMRRDGR